ncbi:MAG: hypothetical protein ACJ77B_07390 [Chloroflexota bacterium]
MTSQIRHGEVNGAAAVGVLFLGQLIALLALAALFSRGDGGRLATVVLAPAVALAVVAFAAGTSAARVATGS